MMFMDLWRRNNLNANLAEALKSVSRIQIQDRAQAQR